MMAGNVLRGAAGSSAAVPIPAGTATASRTVGEGRAAQKPKPGDGVPGFVPLEPIPPHTTLDVAKCGDVQCTDAQIAGCKDACKNTTKDGKPGCFVRCGRYWDSLLKSCVYLCGCEWDDPSRCLEPEAPEPEVAWSR